MCDWFFSRFLRISHLNLVFMYLNCFGTLCHSSVMKPLTLFTNSNLYFFFDINDVLFATNLSQNLTKKKTPLTLIKFFIYRIFHQTSMLCIHAWKCNAVHYNSLKTKILDWLKNTEQIYEFFMLTTTCANIKKNQLMNISEPVSVQKCLLVFLLIILWESIVFLWWFKHQGK